MKEKGSITHGTKVLKSLVRNKISLLLYNIYSIVSQYYYHFYFIADLNASTNDVLVFIFVFVNAYFEITYFYRSLFFTLFTYSSFELINWAFAIVVCMSVCPPLSTDYQAVKFYSGIKYQESYNLYDSRNSVSGML